MVFTFSFDKIFNKYVPPSQTHRFPVPIRRFLGGHKPNSTHDHLIWIEILVASFGAIAMLEGMFLEHTVFSKHHVNHVIASYGATAILCFNASQVPLAQPRNILFGHFLSALIGVCIQKLFSLSHGAALNYWASAGLSVGVASVLMSVCNCVHPPAGASAMLPSIDPNVREMSWWYLAAHVVMSVLIIAVACITGNITRRYPTFWWTAGECGMAYKTPVKPQPQEPQELQPSQPQQQPSQPLSPPVSTKVSSDIQFVPALRSVEITAYGIRVPAELELDDVSLQWLQSLSADLHNMPSA